MGNEFFTNGDIWQRIVGGPGQAEKEGNPKPDSAIAADRKLRKERREVQNFELPESIPVDPEISQEKQAYLKELHQVLLAAWNDRKILPLHLKEVLYKYYLEEKTPEEIDRECGLARGGAKKYLNSAIDNLRYSKYFKEAYGNNKQGRGDFWRDEFPKSSK